MWQVAICSKEKLSFGKRVPVNFMSLGCEGMSHLAASRNGLPVALTRETQAHTSPWPSEFRPVRANAIITRPTSMTLIDDPAEGAGCWAALRRCPWSIDDGELNDWNGSRCFYFKDRDSHILEPMTAAVSHSGDAVRDA